MYYTPNVLFHVRYKRKQHPDNFRMTYNAFHEEDAVADDTVRELKKCVLRLVDLGGTS